MRLPWRSVETRSHDEAHGGTDPDARPGRDGGFSRAPVVAVHDAVAILLPLGNALLLECGLGRCGVEDVPELLAKRVGLKHRRVPFRLAPAFGRPVIRHGLASRG